MCVALVHTSPQKLLQSRVPILQAPPKKVVCVVFFFRLRLTYAAALHAVGTVCPPAPQASVPSPVSSQYQVFHSVPSSSVLPSLFQPPVQSEHRRNVSGYLGQPTDFIRTSAGGNPKANSRLTQLQEMRSMEKVVNIVWYLVRKFFWTCQLLITCSGRQYHQKSHCASPRTSYVQACDVYHSAEGH